MMETKLLESMISITDDVKSIKFIPYRDGKKEIRFMYKGVLVRIGSIRGYFQYIQKEAKIFS